MTTAERIQALERILWNGKDMIPLELGRIGRELRDLLQEEPVAALVGAMRSRTVEASNIRDMVMGLGALVTTLGDGAGPLGPEFELPGTREELTSVLEWVKSQGEAAGELPTLVLLGYTSADYMAISEITGLSDLDSRIDEILEILNESVVELDEPVTFVGLLEGAAVDAERLKAAAELYEKMTQWWGQRVVYGLLATLECVLEITLGFDGSFPGGGDAFSYLVADERSLAGLKPGFERVRGNVDSALTALKAAPATAGEDEPD